MPEGPEVEAARALVHRNVLNLVITKVTAAEDDKVFMGKSPEEVRQALEGRRITAACRKAKYLWFELDGPGPFPLLHFGMTGSVVVENVGAAKYKRVSIDVSEWPPKFWKLQLEFEDGSKLAFSDARRFGRVQLLDNPRSQEPVSKLGFDVIDELPSVEDFTKLFSRYQKPGSTLRIKALLLDQKFTAGVGNWVADEVLYQARVHPEQPVADMTEFQIHSIHEHLKSIMKLAVSVDADSDQFPRDWLFHYRWTGKKASSVNGHAVDFVTVGSRTSAFVPALQKIISGTGLSQQKPERKAPTPRKRKAAVEAGEVDGEPEVGAPEAGAGPVGGQETLQPAGDGAVQAGGVMRKGGSKRRRSGKASGKDEEVDGREGLEMQGEKAKVEQEDVHTEGTVQAGSKGQGGRRGRGGQAAQEREEEDASGPSVKAGPAKGRGGKART